MLNEKKFEETYGQLRDAAEYGADLFAGRTYREMMDEAGISGEDPVSVGIVMQCAAKSIGGPLEEAYNHRNEKTPSELLTEFAAEVLREKLAPYSDQEKKALMISMLDEANDILDQPLDDRERLQLTQAELPDIEKRLLEQTEKIADAAWKKTDFNLPGERWDEIVQPPADFSGDAAMGAVYLSDEEMRGCPELIGSVTGAAIAMQKQLKMEKAAEDLDWISVMLLLLAAAIVISMLISVAYGAGLAAVSNLIAGESVMLFEEVCFFLKECAEVFAFELKVALGFAAAGLAAKAAAMICLAYKRQTLQEDDIDFISGGTAEDALYQENAAGAEAADINADDEDEDEDEVFDPYRENDDEADNDEDYDYA